MAGLLWSMNESLSPLHGVVLLYLIGLTIILLRWQEHGLAVDPKGFVRRFMASLVVKMLLTLGVVVAVMVLIPAPLSVSLTLVCAVGYLAFLAFSTWWSMRLLRRVPSTP